MCVCVHACVCVCVRARLRSPSIGVINRRAEVPASTGRIKAPGEGALVEKEHLQKQLSFSLARSWVMSVARGACLVRSLWATGCAHPGRLQVRAHAVPAVPGGWPQPSRPPTPRRLPSVPPRASLLPGCKALSSVENAPARLLRPEQSYSVWKWSQDSRGPLVF